MNNSNIDLPTNTGQSCCVFVNADLHLYKKLYEFNGILKGELLDRILLYSTTLKHLVEDFMDSNRKDAIRNNLPQFDCTICDGHLLREWGRTLFCLYSGKHKVCAAPMSR